MKNLKVGFMICVLLVGQVFAENNKNVKNLTVTDPCTHIRYIGDSGVRVHAIFDSLGANIECIKTSPDQEKASACTEAQREFLDAMYKKHQTNKTSNTTKVVTHAVKTLLVAGLVGSACIAIAVMVAQR